MTDADPPLPFKQRRQIEVYWDIGLHSAEIAERLKLDEHRVAQVISEYVTAKKLRNSAF
ncbi:hypothetical protein JRF84_08110 [Methylobacterium organophilum]|uniref:hypothetical protein n=1 Tax=Methylobacterium TaxID=407 RepID=UPI0019D272B2|nr:hypothetical protein [Methylobacterium organophilum]MBN6819552.1 hypothetical protein [Methylobacterium organophilum]